MTRDKITGRPEPIYCLACGEYIPYDQASELCPECERQAACQIEDEALIKEAEERSKPNGDLEGN